MGTPASSLSSKRIFLGVLATIGMLGPLLLFLPILLEYGERATGSVTRPTAGTSPILDVFLITFVVASFAANLWVLARVARGQDLSFLIPIVTVGITGIAVLAMFIVR